MSRLEKRNKIQTLEYECYSSRLLLNPCSVFWVGGCGLQEEQVELE